MGHEIDYTIADFVADMRAPTPSAAAELAVRDRLELKGIFLNFALRMASSLKANVESKRQRILNYQKSYGFKRSPDLIRQNAQRVDELNMRQLKAFKQHYRRMYDTIQHTDKILSSLNPKNILNRGYSITLYNGKIIKRVSNLKKGDAIQTQVLDGTIESNITHINPEGKK